jgi:alpha-1,2-mannosyltransferase
MRLSDGTVAADLESADPGCPADCKSAASATADCKSAATFKHRLRRHWLTGLLAVLLLVLSIIYYAKVRHGHQESRSAILRWQNQVLALFDGANIWEKHDYPNPPIMALLLAPLMHLPPLTCSLVWFFLKAVMIVICVHWVFRMIESPGASFSAAGKLLVLALAARPVVGDLTHGNVNIFILFLVVAGLYALYHRRDLTAGLMIGLAIACKVTPALFLPYFFWKRAWRTLAGCTLGLVLFLGVVPGLFLGMERNAVFLTTWTQRMVRPYVVDGIVTAEHINQSLPGLAHRLLRHTPSFTTYTEVGYVPVEYHNLADVDGWTISWLLRGSMVVFALLVMCCCRTPLVHRAGWPLLAEFSVIVIGMLLFSERTWKHHCVTLLLPFTVIGYHMFADRPRGALRRYLAGTLIAAAALMTTTVTIPGVERWGKVAEVYGTYVWAYLVLLAALVVLLRRQQRLAAGAVRSWALAGLLGSGLVFDALFVSWAAPWTNDRQNSPGSRSSWCSCSRSASSSPPAAAAAPCSKHSPPWVLSPSSSSSPGCNSLHFAGNYSARLRDGSGYGMPPSCWPCWRSWVY